MAAILVYDALGRGCGLCESGAQDGDDLTGTSMITRASTYYRHVAAAAAAAAAA
jgi:hypothetical protein